MPRQQRIPNTGRPGIPEALEDASADLLEKRKDKRRITREQNEKVAQAEWKVLTLMQEHNIKQHTVKDSDTEELLKFDLEQVLRISKTGEVESDDGESDDEAPSSSEGTNGIHPGLIAQAEKAQADAGVEVSGDGDVVVPDTAAPKAKGKRGGKKPKLEVVPDAPADTEDAS